MISRSLFSIIFRGDPSFLAFVYDQVREYFELIAWIDVVVDPGESEPDPVSAAWLADEGTFTARRNVERLQQYATGLLARLNPLAA